MYLTASPDTYSPTPNTLCVIRLLSLACVGLCARDEATPRPSNGCRTKNGHNEHQRQRDTDAVVSDPANRALKRLLSGGADTRVPEGATRHVAEPTSEQTVVERLNMECSLQEQIPQVHDQRGANANDGPNQDIACVNRHDSRHYGPWSVCSNRATRKFRLLVQAANRDGGSIHSARRASRRCRRRLSPMPQHSPPVAA